ncbi:hypothetical protein CPB86DRAFT_673488, partial [Serendipita vermifera]
MLSGSSYTILLLCAVSAVTAQCTNNACIYMNSLYQFCNSTKVAPSPFKSCLCTEIFLVNYDRCKRGSVCPWYGDPEKLEGPCVDEFCPGEFKGGFRADEFCA